MSSIDKGLSFSDLALDDNVLSSLESAGYTTPTPIQQQTIPALLRGDNVLAKSQTGTGKTAAFALPLLSKLNLNAKHPQVLILTPTRELALQVSAAFKKYGQNLSKLNILAVYGGAGMREQLQALKGTVHIVVGTPGRIIDHISRKTLDLSKLNTLVLDEADEMLRMGFIDDVERVLQESPKNMQTALFSATMPVEIKKITEKYLKNPSIIEAKNEVATASNVAQKYWVVQSINKLDALNRFLEAENPDATIVFVKTKSLSNDLATNLIERGYKAAALNGDLPQPQRESIIKNVVSGKINVLIATDVAARGIDIPRVTHVINYDLPHDLESYIHRIGRTGRAGRHGVAILFVAKREVGFIKRLERHTQTPVVQISVPNSNDINNMRKEQLKKKLLANLAKSEEGNIPEHKNNVKKQIQACVQELLAENSEVDLAQITTSALMLLNQKAALFISEEKKVKEAILDLDSVKENFDKKRSKGKVDKPKAARERVDHQSYTIAIGRENGIKPGQIVRAICDASGIDSKYIGHIKINQNNSIVDLPVAMPKSALISLRKVKLQGMPLAIARQDH